MKKIFSLLISMTFILPAMAQSGQVKGKVLDKYTNMPVVGALVTLPGKAITTATDKNGSFTVACTDSVRLIISKARYDTATKTVGCGNQIVITLEPSAEYLNTVEITASRHKSQLEQPLSVVKLGPTELKRSTGLHLQEAINTNVPGVIMEKRSNSGGQQINIRGYGNGVGFKGINNNFDMQGIKIYLDGIPLTDAEGVTALDDIDFGSLSHVEVSKGPSGTLYGLAIAGVIHLQTQRATPGQSAISQEFMAGSYGLRRSTTRVAIGSAHSSVLLSLGNQDFDGYMPHTKAHEHFASLTGNFHINKHQHLITYVGYADSYDERNGELTLEQYAKKDYSGNPDYIANNAHSAVRTFRAGISHIYRFNDHFSNTTTFFGAGQNLDNSSAAGWSDKSPLNYGVRSTLDTRFNLTPKIVLSGITGIEMQAEHALSVGYRMAPDSTNLSGYNVITSIKSDQATTDYTASYFTQWTLELPYSISVNAGIGVSNMSLHLEDRLWGINNNHPGNTKLPVYDTSYNNLISPNIAINKKLGKNVSVYAAYSTAYKAPVTSNILISSTGQLNTGLKPERGMQIEIGTKGSFMHNRLFYTLALFDAKFTNKFTSIAVPNPAHTTTLYSYLANGGTEDNKGLEALLKYDLIRSDKGFIRMLSPFVNFTYSNFKYVDFTYQTVKRGQNKKDSVNYSGKTVAGQPPVIFNAGIDAQTSIGLYGNVNLNYRSEMYITSDNLVKTDPYTLLNAKIGFKKPIGDFDLNVYAGANNITGVQYYYMVFINQLPDAYIPAPDEINFYGGINLRYNF